MIERKLIAGLTLIALAGCGQDGGDASANGQPDSDRAANAAMPAVTGTTANPSGATDVRDRVVQIVVAELGVDIGRVTMNARFAEDLGADSTDMIELIMGFEEEFGLEIPNSEAETIKTVGGAVQYLSDQAIPAE
jgi:acyl carrier protein